MRFNYWQTFYEGSYYHVYNRSVGRDWLFVDMGNYKFFLQKWQKYIHPYVDTYAYCLMSNHFHFLVRIKPMSETIKLIVETEKTVASKKLLTNEITFDAFLEDQFKRLFSAYALAFNKQQKRHGTLFQASFKRVKLGNEAKLLNTLCYVHHNPIHHNLTPFYDVWQYSSYTSYLSKLPTLLARQAGLALFDNLGLDTKAFENYHAEYQKQRSSWKKSIDWDEQMLLDEE